MSDPQHKPERRFYRFWARNWELAPVCLAIGIVGIVVGVMALCWAR